MTKDPYKYFRVEAQDLLENLSKGVMDLEKGHVSKERVGGLLRLAHTLKGAARVVKQQEIADLAHAMEDVLEPHREATVPIPKEQTAQLLYLVDACSEHLQKLLSLAEQPGAPSPLRESEEPFASVRVDIAEMDALLFDLAETGVHLGALALETATLAGVERAAGRLLERLAVPSRSRATDGKPSPAMGELYSLAEEVRTGLRHYQRSFQARLEQTQRDFGALRERVSELRPLPARTICPFLERSVRDTAEALKKRVTLAVEGGDHRLDTHTLLAVRDALLHVMRNAVAHGIESELERLAAGKAPVGRVRLLIHKRGQHISFIVEDDGRGIDVAAIGRSAAQQRLVTPAEAETLGLAEATQLLLRGGISTSPQVSEVSGRGVGLDVVRSTAARLKGTVSLHSEPGRGTSVEMIVPVSLESMTVAILMVGDVCTFLPFNAVLRVVRVSEEDLVHGPTGPTLIVEDRALPFQTLEKVFGVSRRRARRRWTAVLVQAAGKQAAVGVDRMAGIRDMVVRPLPALCGPVPLFVGAVLDEGGDPQLVLDPNALITVLHESTGPESASFSPLPVPVLVVDDSLTTRMLEQSILESAGYQVDLATSGEEALEKARQKKYSIFIVDVEMPGINGFELLELFRKDPNLHNTPAILVTSLAAPEDRRRGEQAGARAYIVKSQFHERELLQTIRRLVGEGSS